MSMRYIHDKIDDHSLDQICFLVKTCSLWSWYSALVIHCPFKEGRLAKMLPPYQHNVSRFAGASTRDFTSFGSPLLSSLMNLSGKPSNIVLPPDSTI